MSILVGSQFSKVSPKLVRTQSYVGMDSLLQGHSIGMAEVSRQL